jgi:hypothetical protein
MAESDKVTLTTARGFGITTSGADLIISIMFDAGPFERRFAPEDAGPWLHAVRSRVTASSLCLVKSNPDTGLYAIAHPALDVHATWFDMRDPALIISSGSPKRRTEDALAFINAHRKLHAQHRLDPDAADWLDTDITAEAARIGWEG